MLRTLAIAAAFALAATAASASKIDANGKCHADNGQFAPMEVCKGGAKDAGPYKLDAKGGCHAADGAFAKKEMCKGMSAPAATTKAVDPKPAKSEKAAKVTKAKK